MRQQEYSIDELLDDPTFELVMEEQGIERRSLDLMLETVYRPGHDAGAPLRAPFFG